MSNTATFFLQGCPVCGRPLQVPTQLLGCGVTCQHCSGTFVANDEATASNPANDRRTAMQRRIEALLVVAWAVAPKRKHN